MLWLWQQGRWALGKVCAPLMTNYLIISVSCMKFCNNEVNLFHPAVCLSVFFRGGISWMSTERKNGQVICRILSDSPQKACPSQSSAQQPRLTFLHSALPDNVTGQDSDELRRPSRLITGTKTHTESYLLRFVCHVCRICASSWRSELVSNK